MQNVDFKFDIDFYGCAVVSFDIEGKHYEFRPTYMGSNPLNLLVTGLYYLKINEERDVSTETTIMCVKDQYQTHKIIWEGEPSGQTVVLTKNGDDLLIEISQFSDKECYGRYIYAFVDMEQVFAVHTSFDEFKNKVCGEALRMLRKFGLAGYSDSWEEGSDDFPLSKLLYLMGNTENRDDDNVLYFSNFNNEIKLLTQNE